MLMDEDLRELRVIANTLADAAGTEAMKWFRQAGLETQNKDETGFDPVTHADRNAEAAMRRILAVSRPDDGIFGEEEGQTSGTTGLTWVLDPIDGTRAFISGLPTWGILIALDDGSRGRIGIIDQPFTGERYCGTLAEPSSATLSRAGEERAISTRPCTGLSEATLMTTSPDLFEGGEVSAFAAVRDQSRLIRYGADCYAYAILA
ncbi:MAG: inositol monophosphatase family protein, partial [Pseudomonadota bacterium]